MKTLNRNDIVNIGRQIISSFEIRDEDLLESAIGRQVNGYGVEYPIDMAVTLMWGLIKNHPFTNGNKRLGFASLVFSLNANKFFIKTENDDFWFDLLVGIAEGKVDKQEAYVRITDRNGDVLAPCVKGNRYDPWNTLHVYDTLFKRLAET